MEARDAGQESRGQGEAGGVGAAGQAGGGAETGDHSGMETSAHRSEGRRGGQKVKETSYKPCVSIG